jgi:hypothetical protein
MNRNPGNIERTKQTWNIDGTKQTWN